MVQRKVVQLGRHINKTNPLLTTRRNLLGVVFLKQAPTFLSSIARVISHAITLAESGNGLSASSACSLFSGFQSLECLHFLEYMLQEFFSVDHVQMAADLWIFACELIELLRCKGAEF